MDLWHPPPDEPQLLEWWRPLLIASRKLRQDRFPWLLHLDEMQLTGRVDRRDRPRIWVYKHLASRGELYLDDTGQAYGFTRTPNGRSYGRFTACGLDTAMWRAGLPAHVEPVFYESPPPSAEPDWDLHDLAGHPEGEHRPPASPAPRRRGHLTVIDGGRGGPLAG